jgi:hypothetical protein
VTAEVDAGLCFATASSSLKSEAFLGKGVTAPVPERITWKEE